MKTITQFRKHLQNLFDSIDMRCKYGEPDYYDQLDFDIEIEDVKRLACRFGAGHLIGSEVTTYTPKEALIFVGNLLNFVNGMSDKYIDSKQACDYLGITESSLYGLVERKRIIPLRGPRRSYRFTKAQLDNYLHA
ncbi:MAG: helix-turn-helix domain-containing protein [Thermoguttaceae bacterium]|jgi:excisionase family DNA binding protein